jgi:acyl-CoA synthetase (NDP forming)
MHSVREVLESRNVAVIGASRDAFKPGALILKVLQDVGFKGRVAGVNPQGGEVYGQPLYKSMEGIPFPVDLAVLLIPPRFVAEAVLACAKRGVKGVVVSSEGFSEAGEQGRRYQEDLRTVLRSTGIRGFGPNTLGIVNTETGLTTSYFSDSRMLVPGSIGFVAQSGIFIGALLRYVSSLGGLHISKGLGLGNKVDVNECDALAYLREDEQTRIVGMYLEDIRDGRRFLEEARQTARKKPVLLLKGGRTEEGARAVASHTASLAVDDAVLGGALRQAGVLRMGGIDELLGTLRGFQWMPLPRGGRIALITYSGAQGIMSIDAAMQQGLGVARFAAETRSRLSEVIATEAKAGNPIDIFPDMLVHGFEKISVETVRALLEDEGVHAIFFISFAIGGSEPYRPVVELVREKRTKPVFFSLLGRNEDVASCRQLLEENQIPFYLFPDMGVRVLRHMLDYARIVERRDQGETCGSSVAV